MLRFLLIFVMALSLAACGGSSDEGDDAATTGDDDTTTTTSTDAATDEVDTEDASEAETDFVLTVSGAENFEFEEAVRFSCVEDTMTVTSFTQAPKLDIYLPSSVQPGTYTLADFDPNSEQSYVEGAAVVGFSGEVVSGSGSTYGDFYFQNSSGELVITEVPAAIGERFVAELNATLEDGDGDAVTLTGSFDLEETGSVSMGCEYGS